MLEGATTMVLAEKDGVQIIPDGATDWFPGYEHGDPWPPDDAKF